MVWTNRTKQGTNVEDGRRATRAINLAEKKGRVIVGVAPIRRVPSTGPLANGGCISPARFKPQRETSGSAGRQPLPNAWAYGRRSILRRQGPAYAPNVSGRWKYRIQAMMRHPSESRVSSFIGRACVSSYTNAGIWRRTRCPALEFLAEIIFGRANWVVISRAHARCYPRAVSCTPGYKA